MKKYLIAICFVLLLAGQGWGADCGGETACACGDTLTSSYTLTADLECTNAGDALTIGANDVTLDGAGFSIIGDNTNVDKGVYSFGYNNLTVKNLTVRNVTEGGIVIRNGTSPIVEDCTIYDSGTVGENVDGIFIGDNVASGGIVRRNVVHDMAGAGSGIDISGDATGPSVALVYGNIVYDNESNGISCSGPVGNASQASVYNNIIYGNKYNLYVYNYSTANFYNNFIGSADTWAVRLGLSSGATSATVDLKNNIIWGTYAFAVVVYAERITLTSSYNIIGNGTSNLGNISGTAKTFAEWQAAGYDATGSSQSNPLLNADGSLTPASPAINAGTLAETVGLTGNQTDGFGNSYFFAPYDRLNIGADQRYSDADLRPTRGGKILYGKWGGIPAIEPTTWQGESITWQGETATW